MWMRGGDTPIFVVAPCQVLMVPEGLQAQEPSWLQSELDQAGACELWMLEAAAKVAYAGIKGMWHPSGAAAPQLVWYR